jgi:hypothetical protein
MTKVRRKSYATLVGLTFTPDVFACGVDIVGPSNLVTLLRRSLRTGRPRSRAAWAVGTSRSAATSRARGSPAGKENISTLSDSLGK